MRWLALALAAFALAGCESTQERSAALERAAKHRRATVAASGLKITKVSRTIRATEAFAIQGSESSAVAVELHNAGGPQRDVPLEISVAQSGGPAFTNTQPGLAPTLTTIGYVPARSTTYWVDDQATFAGRPGAARAEAGEGEAVKGAAPDVVVASHQLESEGSTESVTGTVSNRSAIEQRELAVYAVAVSGSRIVAAGRAVIPDLAAGSSARYQAFLTGSARGARLIVTASPRTFG